MSRFFAIIGLISLLPLSPAYAQSTFFDKGESGYGILVGYSGSDNVDGFWATAGQSFKGVFDVGFEVGKYEDNWAYGGYASYYPVRGRSMATPIAVAIDMSAGVTDVSRWTWQGSVSRKYIHLTAGLSLHHTVRISPTSFMELAGSAGVGWLFHDSHGEQGQGILSAGVPLGFRISKTTHLLIAPSVSHTEGVTTVSMAVGFCGLSGHQVRDWDDQAN